MYHSKTSIAFGSGHDLCISLIDLEKCESTIYSYQMPTNVLIDRDKFMAGSRDKWKITELEVFLISEPVEDERYLEIVTSLVNIAHSELPIEVQWVLRPDDFTPEPIEQIIE